MTAHVSSDGSHVQGQATARIAEAFSSENLRQLGHQLVELLADHMQRVQQSGDQVLNWNDPEANVARSHELLRQPRSPQSDAQDSPVSDELIARFRSLIEESLSRGHNLHDPRYIGHQVPAPVPIAGLFDALGSITNQVMAIYEMGPWATAVERSLVELLGSEIGFDDGSFAGLVTHGGSLGNLTALLTARNVSLQDVWQTGLAARDVRPVVVTHSDAHYSVSRAVGVIGIGTEQVVKAAIDDRRRMEPNRLDETLSDLKSRNIPVAAVSACACATPIGAFDRLQDIADVCRRHDVWLHVDAAHGGAACLSRRYRHLVRGLNRADSLVMDAHKMLFVPALCAFVFYGNREHRFETFQQNAPYLFDPSAPGLAEYDSGMLTPECTKRAAAFGLWGTWSLFGRELFEDMVDTTFDLGRTFHELLEHADDFEPMHEPECNIVAFRHIPAALTDAPETVISQFLHEVRHRLIRSGEFYIVQASLDGQQALRVTIINPLTTRDHLTGLMDAIRRIGRDVLDGK